MIPQLTTHPDIAPISPVTDRLLSEIQSRGFAGDIQTDIGTRMVLATDNSVYQVVPQAAVFPKNKADVVILMQTCRLHEFSQIPVTVRGGGTGTNGQSLTSGIVVDVSRHMNHILEVNIEEKWVRVEPGVILDRLNAHLRPSGLFFGPTLSPSNRATLGGMISTDASGKGSRVYGKTSDHILELDTVLADGTSWRSTAINEEQLNRIAGEDHTVGWIHRTVRDSVVTHQNEIRTIFPKINRFMTGYNLAMVWNNEKHEFNLNRLIAGSEGTLGIVVEARLNLLEIPKFRRLIVLKYPSFDEALAAAQMLAESQPTAIETIDDKILSLAKQDVIWAKVGPYVSDTNGQNTAAINLVEYASNNQDDVDTQVRNVIAALNQRHGQRGAAHGYYIAKDETEYKSLWELRKKGVGLLGNTKGLRKPVPFVEDTVVPPIQLPEFVRRFREVLDEAGLTYGMFGHVDVGCLHVRPALDLKNVDDERLLREISDKISDLVQQFGGVLWGEHGKGYRSEYVPRYFGDTLYRQMRIIKKAFDPNNQLNPGKLAVPDGIDGDLATIDGPKRGWFDRQISLDARTRFAVAVDCNGNAACFNEDADDVMCPSYKVTRDRIHSPKGRASLMREWLRQLAHAGYQPNHSNPAQVSFLRNMFLPRRRKNHQAVAHDFSHDVYDAMNGCLACKACATQCPIRVDVPDFRSDFYSLYHTRYARPLRDYFVGALEKATHWMARMPRIANWLMGLSLSQWFLRRCVGIVDSPRLTPFNVTRELKRRGALALELNKPREIASADRTKAVILLQDTFTSCFDGTVVLDIYDFLGALGYKVWVVPPFVNGKGLHTRGFLRHFQLKANQNLKFLRAIGDLETPIIGIDPAITLTYRDEYVKLPRSTTERVPVSLIQEWLASQLGTLIIPKLKSTSLNYVLFGHCTEKSLAVQSQTQWVGIFAAFGLQLRIENTGCCGMSGVFGHESEHVGDSRMIFEAGWKNRLDKIRDPSTQVVVTGYSCRAQVKRFHSVSFQHPIQALLSHVRNNRLSH